MISGNVTTKKQLNVVLNQDTAIESAVSLGGTVVGSSLSQRGFTGARGATGATGEQGETGNGIESAVLNSDYTLTLTFTDGTTYTTPSIRGETGEQGEQGIGIASISKTATSGLVDTYTITYTDSTTDTFTVTNGEESTLISLTNLEIEDLTP